MIDEKIEYKWHNVTKQHFIEYGYIFTFRGDVFHPLTQHLPDTSTYKIRLQCDNCRVIKSVRYGLYKRSITYKERGFGAYYCKSCASNNYKVIDIIGFQDILFEIEKGEYLTVGAYESYRTHVNLLHTKCGKITSMRPIEFVHDKRRCAFCTTKRRIKTSEIYKFEVSNLVGEDYLVMGDYIKSSVKIKHMHTVCGYEYFVTPNEFLSGCRCPQCSSKNKISKEKFAEEVRDLVGEEYCTFGDYVNKNTKVKIKHNLCGHEYSVLPSHFLRRKVRCPKCNGRMKKTTDEFIESVCERVGNEYTVLGEYTNSTTKIPIRHENCSYEWYVEPNAFLNGSRCPKCANSRGEKIICNFLDAHNVDYQMQYKFSDCKNKIVLPFDFAIFKDKSLIFLIEYDGIQHFEPIDFFGGQEGYESTVRNDKIKNKYCERNNIELFRIPYWTISEINSILQNILFENESI